MANNRLWLVYKPTGRKIMIGKRMGWGWYKSLDYSDQLDEFFQGAQDDCSSTGKSQDDFVLEFEHGQET